MRNENYEMRVRITSLRMRRYLDVSLSCKWLMYYLYSMALVAFVEQAFQLCPFLIVTS